VERKTRQKKRVFYGCNNYPACNFAVWERPVPDPCPKCGGLMVIPKVGQDPVCYEEVIAAQRNIEEKPRQAGDAQPNRSTRKKKYSGEAGSESSSSGASGTRSKATRSTRKKKQSGVVASEGSPSTATAKRSKPTRSTGKKKASADASSEGKSKGSKVTKNKETSNTRKKEISGEAVTEPIINGASATDSKTTRKKTTIAMLANTDGESTQDETTVHGRTNGHTSAKTANAMAKNR